MGSVVFVQQHLALETVKSFTKFDLVFWNDKMHLGKLAVFLLREDNRP